MLLQQQQYSRHIYIHPFYHSIPFHSIPFHSILPIPFLEYEFGIEFHSFVVLSENLVFIPSSSRKRTPECVTKYLVTIKYFWYFFEIFGNISTNLVMHNIFGPMHGLPTSRSYFVEVCTGSVSQRRNPPVIVHLSTWCSWILSCAYQVFSSPLRLLLRWNLQRISLSMNIPELGFFTV